MTAVDELVVLVNEHGDPIGTEHKSRVHHSDTPLHLAFSLYLFDPTGRILMTRRALNKATWPGVWTNSCCGHPLPAESMEDAVRRRLDAELHLQVTDLRCVLPDFAYREQDASGVWENEICPVFTGRVLTDGTIAANPAEVMDWSWTDWADLVTAMSGAAFAFSPWAVHQVDQMRAPHRAGAGPSLIAPGVVH